MHLNLLTYVFFLWPALLFSQDLAKMQIIGKPERSNEDIVTMRDVNGEFCAGVQVISDMDGFSYDSYNGVVQVDDQPGRDLVYLSPDERVLEVFKTGHQPLKIILSEIGINLRPKVVWRIKIKGGPRAADLLPITLLIEPKDVNVLVDGKAAKVGKPVQLTKGSHQINIAKDGYETIADKIMVSKDQVLFNYTLKEVDLLQIVIKSIPSSARIFINTMEKGETDKGFFLYPGDYRLKLTKPGYLDVEESIHVEKNSKNEFSYRLPTNSGTLAITVNPADAKVQLNREDYSNRTRIALAPGRYKIEINQDGYHSASETVTIERNQTLRRSFSLAAITGRLQFNVFPLNARIALKRKEKVVKSWQGMKQLPDLLVGEYELQCGAAGYATESRLIKITENNTALVDIKLKKSRFAGPRVDRTVGNMIFVEGGTFEMGSKDGYRGEREVHPVVLNSFYITKYEITQKEWIAVMGNNPSRFRGENNPVETVTWPNVVQYCNKRSVQEGLQPCYTIAGRNVTCDFSANGYRLPTEAEWEYAARGGNKSNGYKFSGSDIADQVGWGFNNSFGNTHAVGRKQPNELGLYDMSGNVWEWCYDWHYSNYYRNSPQNNPKGPSSGKSRVKRGGAWNSVPVVLRNTIRSWNAPSDRYHYLGFRCVRSGG